MGASWLACSWSSKAARDFRTYMEDSGYAYSEETDNPAYQLFAKGG